MDEDELPPLDEQPDESALAAEAAWQRLQLERQQWLSAAPPQQQPQGPAGAQTYDDAAGRLAAFRRWNASPEKARWDRQSRQEAFNNAFPRGMVPTPTIPPDDMLAAARSGTLGQLAQQYPKVQLPAPNVQSAAPQPAAPQPAAPQAAAPQDDYKEQLAAWMQRLEQSRVAQEAEINAGYERSRPSESEKWLAIAAALASPTQHGSFGEVMGNVFQSLLGYKQGVRGAENTRQQQLAQLRRAYDLEGTRALARGLKPPTVAKPPRLAMTPLPGEVRDPYTGEVLNVPNEKAWSDLAQNPSDQNLANFIRAFPQAADKATTIVAQARTQGGGM